MVSVGMTAVFMDLRLFLSTASLEIGASGGKVILVSDEPVEPPDIEVDTPDWLEPFGILADLPPWVQAALVSAAAAALLVVVVMVIRLVVRSISRRRIDDGSQR